MATRIVFNGVEYASPDDMPADVRTAYDEAIAMLADADSDGRPDVVERARAMKNVIGIDHTIISVNGETYHGVDEMPPDVRAAYEQAMAALDRNRDGIPDVLQGGGGEGSGAPAPELESRAFVVHKEFTLGGGSRRPVGLDSGTGRPPGLVVETGARTGLLLVGAIVVGAILLFLWLA